MGTELATIAPLPVPVQSNPTHSRREPQVDACLSLGGRRYSFPARTRARLTPSKRDHHDKHPRTCRIDRRPASTTTPRRQTRTDTSTAASTVTSPTGGRYVQRRPAPQAARAGARRAIAEGAWRSDCRSRRGTLPRARGCALPGRSRASDPYADRLLLSPRLTALKKGPATPALAYTLWRLWLRFNRPRKPSEARRWRRPVRAMQSECHRARAVAGPRAPRASRR